MQRIAKFHKVSYQQFEQDWKATFPQSTSVQVQNVYDDIQVPKRATTGSAGYDFYTPIKFLLRPKESIKIPTGIRAEIQEGWVLLMHPRSSLGFKFRLQLDNTTGVIDSDYVHSDNEGHIFAKITNDSNDGKSLQLLVGEAFLQGIFLPFGITEDDDVREVRNGGFGSTNALGVDKL